jgi:murein L,D-transpeptidase YcbB/YkuD
MTFGVVGAAFGLVRSGKALAAPGSVGGQAEWVQKYDTDAGLSVPRTTTPILSPQTVAATEDAIGRYQQIVDGGGWNKVPATKIMKLGSTGNAVVALRRRLAASGDLDTTVANTPVFDSFVEAAVRKFQARHGLATNGTVNQETFDALNIPADVRLNQLEINLVRLRAFSGNLGDRFVGLNIPAASVETVENGVVVSHHRAGVGKIDRQSPVMQAKALEINFNPFWTVPSSIIRKDLIPKMQADPNYLTENHIRVFDKTGQEVSSDSINWNSLDAVNYRFRQDPGGDFNSLGFVRVNIPNPYGVYMHDTPEKGDDFRFVSSGCVRVQDIRDFAAWLLKDNPGWDRDHIDQVIQSGERLDVKLTQPVNVYWAYVTAWANDGLVQFREDIYHRDGFGPAPGAVAAASPNNGAVLQPMSER